MLSHILQTLYPALLAAVNFAIGGGFLYLRGVSLVGVLMSVLGFAVICHIAYEAIGRSDAVLHNATQS